jgi:hypothetical protein
VSRGRLEVATESHVEALAADPRPADVVELWAQARETPASAMRRGMASGVFAFTGLVDDEPILMFGVTPASLLGGVGCPWMVGSGRLERNARVFVPACRGVVAEMNRMFPVLRNFVDERNTLAVRWLDWLGFAILPAVPFGPDRLPFHPFEKRAHV